MSKTEAKRVAQTLTMRQRQILDWAIGSQGGVITDEAYRGWMQRFGPKRVYYRTLGAMEEKSLVERAAPPELMPMRVTLLGKQVANVRG